MTGKQRLAKLTVQMFSTEKSTNFTFKYVCPRKKHLPFKMNITFATETDTQINTVDQNREPRNKPTHLWSINL